MTAELAAAIVHYRTPDLLARAVASFRTFYPNTHLLLIDNGSTVQTAEVLNSLISRYGPGEVLSNSANLHHGPAMHQALSTLKTPLALVFDSDVVVLRGGMIERMEALLAADPLVYAVGQMTWMDDRGFDLPEASGGHPYIRPVCMLLRRDLYHSLPPFERHGAPCLRNMVAAVERGYRLLDFPTAEFIRHDGRGTATRHGYRLGLRGRINHLLHRLGF